MSNARNSWRGEPRLFGSGAMYSTSQPCDRIRILKSRFGCWGTVSRKGLSWRHRGCEMPVGVDQAVVSEASITVDKRGLPSPGVLRSDQ